MLLEDLLLIAPLHITNDLVFLVMRWKLLGSMHKKDRLVSESLFGTHRTLLGLVFIFFSNTLLYLLATGNLLLLPALGAVVGVHANSFVKRRLSIKEGGALPIFDQLDFFIGGVTGLALSGIYLSDLPLMVALSFAAHLFSNICVHIIGMKEVWW